MGEWENMVAAVHLNYSVLDSASRNSTAELNMMSPHPQLDRLTMRADTRMLQVIPPQGQVTCIQGIQGLVYLIISFV